MFLHDVNYLVCFEDSRYFALVVASDVLSIISQVADMPIAWFKFGSDK